jgi:hypothetical protein
MSVSVSQLDYAKLICVRHGLGHRGGPSPWIEAN